MVPKVEGAWDIHYVDRLLAQLEAKAGLERPMLVHAILETAQGVVNVEEIATASPRMQGMSFGPADLAASRRMKTTRVGGGHPGYLVIKDPDPDDPEAPRATAQQDPWHYSIARMVDACTSAGLLPFYGPYGDIKDVQGCETQFRAAFLLGCVGAWSLHPVQIEIAKKVFSPDPDEVKFAKKVIEAIPDGRGRTHDRRQDAGRRDVEAVQGDGRAGRDAGAQGSGAGRGLPGSENDRSRRGGRAGRAGIRADGRARRRRPGPGQSPAPPRTRSRAGAGDRQRLHRRHPRADRAARREGCRSSSPSTAGPYRMAELTNRLAAEARRQGADWVLPIDADEFFVAPAPLPQVLGASDAGALRIEVVNFVQRHRRRRPSERGLLTMDHRPARTIAQAEARYHVGDRRVEPGRGRLAVEARRPRPGSEPGCCPATTRSATPSARSRTAPRSSACMRRCAPGRGSRRGSSTAGGSTSRGRPTAPDGRTATSTSARATSSDSGGRTPSRRGSLEVGGERRALIRDPRLREVAARHVPGPVSATLARLRRR